MKSLLAVPLLTAISIVNGFPIFRTNNKELESSVPQIHFNSPPPSAVLALSDDDKHEYDDLTPIEQAARRVRQLVHISNLATVSTIYQDGDRKGLPVGRLQYYADCIGEEDPDQPLTFIGLNISTVFKNVNKGSPASLAIRLGDTSPLGLTPISPAGSPRVSLFGEFIEHRGDKELAKKCFLRSHHDAHAWIPGDDSKVHDSYWVKFNITGINYIGGFGDKNYIGDIPVELYRNVTLGRRHRSVIHDSEDKQLNSEWKDWIQMTEHLVPNLRDKLLPLPVPEDFVKSEKTRVKCGGKKHNTQDKQSGAVIGYAAPMHAKHSSKHPDHGEHHRGHHANVKEHHTKTHHKCGDRTKWRLPHISFFDKLKSLFSFR